MDQHQIDKVFTFEPNTPEQDEDLQEVYRQAKRLALSIRERLDVKYQDQALGQLTQVLAVCRQAIELSPRQARALLVV